IPNNQHTYRPFPSQHHSHVHVSYSFSVFFFNDPPTTEIYTLSLHDALPISTAIPSATAAWASRRRCATLTKCWDRGSRAWTPRTDRKSTRLNSSHVAISYAVFCLKKKN